MRPHVSSLPLWVRFLLDFKHHGIDIEVSKETSGKYVHELVHVKVWFGVEYEIGRYLMYKSLS